MEEKELLKKISLFKEIKPSQEWVFLTKKRIFKDEIDLKEKFSLGEILFRPIKRPILAFAFRGMILFSLVLIGSIFYLFHLNLNIQKIISDQLTLSPSKYYNNEEEKEIITMLKEMRKSLEKIELSLNNLKNLENPSQTLAMTEVIKITANLGEKTIKDIKEKNSSSDKILASLTLVENEFKELKEASDKLQKEKLANALIDLKKIDLTEDQEARLQKAQEYYNEGRYNEAMVLITKIFNN